MDLKGVCLVSGQFRGIREGLLHGLENHDATRSSMFHFVIHVGGGNFTAQPRRIYGRRHPTSWDRFGFTKVAGISLFIWGQWTRFGPMSDGLRPWLRTSTLNSFTCIFLNIFLDWELAKFYCECVMISLSSSKARCTLVYYVYGRVFFNALLFSLS